MPNILIIGDSFAADWTVKYPNQIGWPNLLSRDYLVTNLAKAGIGEFKVWKQIQSINNLNNYDLILISHCSPWRLSTLRHPIHCNDILHGDSDLIFADIEYHINLTKSPSKELKVAYDFFKYHFDKEYHDEVCRVFRQHINNYLRDCNSLILNFRNPKFDTEQNVLDFSQVFVDNPGQINHLSDIGNNIVYNKIISYIQQNKIL